MSTLGPDTTLRPDTALGQDSGAAPDLSRRIEEASVNAWPALHQVLYDGWLLRFARGFTKRANSVVPLYPSLRPVDEKIRHCENLYARERLNTIFRLTSLPEHERLARDLTARGYRQHDQTLVLRRKIEQGPLDPGFRQLGLDDWLALYAALTQIDGQTARLHGLLLKGIRTECCYGVIQNDQTIVACGLAVVEAGLVGLFDVVTHAEHRQQGYGQQLVSALLQWAHGEGAAQAYLQVVGDNQPARALYRRLGFDAAHSYSYYSAP